METKGGTEAAQAAAAGSLDQPGKEPTYAERLAAANTPEALRAFTRDVAAGRIKSTPADAAETKGDQNGAPLEPPGEGVATVEEAGAPKPEGDTAAATTTEPAAGETGETATAGGETKPAADASEGETAKPEGEGEDEDGKLPDRIRLTNFSEVEKLALQIKRTAEKAGKKMSLGEAEKNAMAMLGVTANPTAEGAGDGAAAASTLPATLADTDAKIAELKAQRTKARTVDLDFELADKLDNEIDALREHKSTLRESEARAASAEQAKYDNEFNASTKKAGELYDFVKQPDSAAYKRMQEIDRQLEASDDPLHRSPNKPLKVAQMVAAEMAIAPRALGAKPAAGAVTKVTQPARPATTQAKTVPPVVAASGASRTSTSSTQGGELSQMIHSAKTPADLEAIRAKLGAPRRF
jgi:hypothetical protein